MPSRRMCVYCLSVFLFCLLSTVDAQEAPINETSTNSSQRPKKTIHILGLMPVMKVPHVPITHVVLPTVELALQQINAREDILPDYELKLHWRDTQCLPGPGVDALYELLYTPPAKTMIFGALCSPACVPIVRASLLWNISSMAFGCNTPSLSDHEAYPYFFRCQPSEGAVIPSIIKLMKFYNWKRVAMIHEAQEYWSMYTEELHSALDEANATIVSSEIFLGDPSLQVRNLQKHKVRIVLGGFYQDAALRVLCEAYKIGYYGPNIVWFMFAWYTDDIWQQTPSVTDCTAEEVFTVVRTSAFFVGVDNSNPDNLHTPMESGMSRAEGYAFLESLFGPDVTGKKYMVYMYDGTWAGALVLHRAAEKMKKLGFPRGLDEFNYDDAEMTELITSSVEGLQFQGIFGPVKFEGGNSPVVDMFIQQQWENDRLTVGWLKVGSEDIEWSDRGILWEKGYPPRDSEIVVYEVVRVKYSLYIFMFTLTTVGIIYSMVLLVFNVHFKQRKIIKMSSPNINNVMLVGCLISYTAVFFTPTRDEVVPARGSCIATLSTLLVGFSLMFGALFSKTWRIHVIMRSATKSIKKVIIKDTKLISIVLGLVLVDVSVIVLWQGIDPFTVVINGGAAEESTTDPDVWIVPQTAGCQSEYQAYFSGVLYGIQGLMLAFGAFLAWETRQVKLAALNDSKEIGMCIYNVLILGVMGVLINLVVDDVDVKYGFTSSTIIAATALVQCLIFIPKIMAVYRGDESGVGPASRVGTTGTDKSTIHPSGGGTASTQHASSEDPPDENNSHA